MNVGDLIPIGGSGNVKTNEVLQDKTFSSNDGTDLVGTMPNNGAKIITPSTVNQAIPNGCHNGLGYIKGDSNLKASNIADGVSVFGITGTHISEPRILSRTVATQVLTVHNSSAYRFAHLVEVTNLGFTPKAIIIGGKDCFRRDSHSLEYAYGVGYKYSTNTVYDPWDMETEGSYKTPPSNSNFIEQSAPYVDVANKRYIQFQTHAGGFHWYVFMCSDNNKSFNLNYIAIG